MISKHASLGCFCRSFGTTADIGIRVAATSFESLLSTAAEGLFSLICDRRTVRPTTEREIKISGENPEFLMVAWLNELIYIFDANTFLIRRCSVRSLEDHEVTAVVAGETYNPSRHSIKTVFKAATYHGLRVHNEAGGWKAVVIFDI